MTAAATAQELYDDLEMGGTLPRGQRPGVLVVDLQMGFTDPAHPTGCDLAEVVASTRRVLDVARRRGHPVIFTTIAYEPHLRDLGIWRHKMPGLSGLQRGTSLVEIDERLAREPGESLVEKTGASAVNGTNVVPLLVSLQVDTVVLCGATTSGCIRASAVDLMHNRFPTLVPRECVGDRAAAPHEANLFDMNAKYADVVAVDDVIAYLDRSRQ